MTVSAANALPVPRPVVLIVDVDAAYLASRLMRDVPGVEVLVAESPERCDVDLSRVGGLLGLGRMMTDDLVGRMPQLRWLQFLTSGTDKLAGLASLRPDIVVTSAHGIHGPAVSEMALTMMLSLSRDLPALLADQRAHRWHKRPQPLLHGKTLVVLGTGVIAQALAERCGALGMNTVGVSSSPRGIASFDRVMPRSELHAAAGLADFLVALLPLTDDTRGLVDRAVLDHMKPTAFVVNLARGPICVAGDLLDALRRRRIAGAGLDVFDIEPLAEGDPLWDLPNVIITPHIGGESDRYADSLLPLLTTNLRHFAQQRYDLMVNKR